MNAPAVIRIRPTVQWLMKLFRRPPAPPTPVLLRLAASDGERPDRIDVSATWFPSGKRRSREHRGASGLFVIPWVGEEQRVRLAIRTAAGQHELEVTRERALGGRVHDLLLG